MNHDFITIKSNLSRDKYLFLIKYLNTANGNGDHELTIKRKAFLYILSFSFNAVKLQNMVNNSSEVTENKFIFSASKYKTRIWETDDFQLAYMF